LAFVDKQINKPTRKLKSVEEVESFLSSRNSSSYSTSTVMVVGFFSDDMEEDDLDDFVEVAKDLQIKEDVYFAVVTDRKVCEWYKKDKTIDRTPSVILMGDNGVRAINLDAMFGEKFGLKEWINNNAIPLVGKMTNSNFKLYEKIPNPMLMLFLDLTHEDASLDPGKVVGGKSGKILNENLLDEFRHVAKEHSEKITFVYLDGVLHEDRMKTLGESLSVGYS
jgi:Thioredoxin-like domain